jgi:hypothetical protein
MSSKKEIKVLSERDHILLRPTVYVGSVKPTDEKVPIIKDNKLFVEQRTISVGMYKLFDEVFSNSLDEAKRMNGKMQKITISIDSTKNSVTIRDTGNGFYKGTEINSTSGKSNIETAVSQLRAGSNFENEDVEESLVGTNGMGVSLVNVLSKYFSIETINDKFYYFQDWKHYEGNEPQIQAKTPGMKSGTAVTFIPFSEVFGYSKWDKEVLSSILILKYDLIKRDPVLGKLEIELEWDGRGIDLGVPFVSEDSFKINTDIGQITIWEKYDGSGSLSFVNSALCTGIHQKIVNDFVNDKLQDTLGHHFYDCLIVLNLPPKYVKFGDQNKTRFVTTREEIESLLTNKFGAKLQGFFKTEMFERILKKVDERKNEGYVKKLRSEKKKVNLKHSHKYFPAQKSIAENLFIVEGLCIKSDEKINVWREGELLNIQLDEVLVGDEVITHRNRFRRIINKQKKLKECVKINLKDGTELVQTEDHRYYVFNKKNNTFEFVKVKNLDLSYHFLIKSNLGNFIGTVEVVEKMYSKDERYPNILVTDAGEYHQCSNEHKYCTLIKGSSEFNMVEAKDINSGDLICVFDNIQC